MAIKRSEIKFRCMFATFCVVVVLIIFGIVALNLRKFWDSTRQSYACHKGDEMSIKQVANDFSTTMCQGFSINSTDVMKVYLLPRRVEIDHEHRISLLDRWNINGLFPRDPHYRGFYLLSGSHIQVSGCRKNENLENKVPAEIILFKGETSWVNWKGVGTCDWCPFKTVTIQEKEMCNENNATMEFKVGAEDNFYVLVSRKNASDKSRPVYLNIFLNVSRTQYNLTGAGPVCINPKGCIVDLDYDSDEDIVVTFPEEQNTDFSTAFSSCCQLRVMFWAGIFAGLPGSVIILILFCCCCCASCSSESEYKPSKKMVTVCNIQNSEDALINNESYVPVYHSVNSQNESA